MTFNLHDHAYRWAMDCAWAPDVEIDREAHAEAFAREVERAVALDGIERMDYPRFYEFWISMTTA